MRRSRCRHRGATDNRDIGRRRATDRDGTTDEGEHGGRLIVLPNAAHEHFRQRSARPYTEGRRQEQNNNKLSIDHPGDVAHRQQRRLLIRTGGILPDAQGAKMHLERPFDVAFGPVDVGQVVQDLGDVRMVGPDDSLPTQYAYWIKDAVTRPRRSARIKTGQIRFAFEE